MTNALFENGRNNYLTGNLNWTSDTVSGALLDLTQSTASCKQISGATNTRENLDHLLSICSCSRSVGTTVPGSYLYGGTQPSSPQTVRKPNSWVRIPRLDRGVQR